MMNNHLLLVMLYILVGFSRNIPKTHSVSHSSTMNLPVRGSSWKTYISEVYIKLISAAHGNHQSRSLVPYMRNLHQNRNLFNCKMYDMNSQQYTHIKDKCAFIRLETWHPLSAVLHIEVHSAHMINFTISEAYVPYTDNCHPHSIVLFRSGNSTNLLTLCGVIYMESFYVQYSEILVQLHLEPYRLHTSVHMYAA